MGARVPTFQPLVLPLSQGLCSNPDEKHISYRLVNFHPCTLRLGLPSASAAVTLWGSKAHGDAAIDFCFIS